MGKVTGFHHVAIRSADFDRTVEFYREVMGLPLKTSWTGSKGRAALIEISSGSYIEVFEWEPTSMTGEPAILHFSFRTDDVDGMTERARAHGYTVTMEPTSMDIRSSAGLMKLRLSFVLGPDGEEIELMSS